MLQLERSSLIGLSQDWTEPGKEPAMTTHVLQFVELSDQDRKAAKPLGKLGKGDQVEVQVRRNDNCEWPLGRDIDEAVRMLDAAERIGIPCNVAQLYCRLAKGLREIASAT